MKKHYQFIAVLSAFSLALSGLLSQRLPVSVHAADSPRIVVIGDGISSGEGLADGEKSYVDWIAYYSDAEIQNFAQDSYMTGDVLQSLDNPDIQSALADADMIFVTVGNEDIMNPFFQTAQDYMAEFGFDQFADVFYAKLEDHNIASEDDLLPYSNRLSKAARSNKSSATENFQAITQKLTQYQNAQVIYQTVYNATDTIENLESISAKRQTAYNGVCNPIKTLVASCYNNLLHELETQGQCKIADVYTAFEGYAYKYTNLNYLNANPTAEGHRLMADLVMKAAGIEKHMPLGDLNYDKIVDASDASALLKAAANIGADMPSGLSDETELAADVNGDGRITAVDASFILKYAAGRGSDEINVSFDDYMQSK